MKLGFDLNLEYVPDYFDTTIDNLLTKQEELDAQETVVDYQSIAVQAFTMEVERVLCKAKLDCLNLLSLGNNAQRLEY